MTSTQERITEAALTLISERGLSDVTMIDVARTAGIARQTLYNHYPDIDTIVADALNRHNQDSIDQLRSAVAVVNTPTDKVTQLVRHIAQISIHTGHTIDLDRSLAPQHRASLTQFTDAIDELTATAIAEGQTDGSFRLDLDPTIDTALVRHILVGISNLIAVNPEDAPTIAATGTRTILSALTNP
jgi:AcrR family transcriptional regulator